MQRNLRSLPSPCLPTHAITQNDMCPHPPSRQLPSSFATIKSRSPYLNHRPPLCRHAYFRLTNSLASTINPFASADMHSALSRSFFLASVLVVLTLLSPTTACSCIRTTLKRSYFESFTKFVVRATPISTFQTRQKRIYVLRVQTVYKGCTKRSTLVVETALNSAACGVFLRLRTSYLLTLGQGSPLTINLCSVSVPILVSPLLAFDRFSLYPLLTFFS